MVKPKKDTIHAVTVVPMLAPIMTPMAWTRVSSPALTRLTVITVVALDDCIIPVNTAPVSIRRNGLEVIGIRNERSLYPASFCKAELIRVIPNRKSPNEPIIYNILKNTPTVSKIFAKILISLQI